MPRFFDGKLPDLNFGTADGASCDGGLTSAVVDIARAQEQFTVALNGRFKGGHITRHYGQPAARVHAIQLEMCQCLYMDESGAVRLPARPGGTGAAAAAPDDGSGRGMGGALSGCLFARHALLPQGWRRDVLLEWDAAGDLTAVTDNAAPPPGAEVAQYVLPGMVNLHSHAFQRALGGMTEVAGDGPDSFWTWRELMYRFARHITPEQMESIAAQLFAECLRHGYTAVCEFHYLQRDMAGALYARPAETAERVLAAARISGIGVTMLPVLYSHAGFGAQPLKPEQARFRTGADDVLRIVEALAPQRGGQVEVGFAPHSLRAAGVAQIRGGGASAACGPPHPHPYRRAAGRSAPVSRCQWPAPGAVLCTIRSTSTRAGASCMPRMCSPTRWR